MNKLITPVKDYEGKTIVVLLNNPAYHETQVSTKVLEKVFNRAIFLPY